MLEPTVAEGGEQRSRTAETVADGAAAVWDAVRGVWRFAALNVMVELGCADHLAGGPLTVTELADRCGADAPSLARVLRAVAAMGFARTVSAGTYALTEAGTVLCTNGGADPAGISVPLIAFSAEQASWQAMGALPDTVRTGRPLFVERFGTLYEYLAANPETGRIFSDFMVARSRPLAARVADVYDFSGAASVVDVGGGSGTFLAAILNANAHLRGVLFETESTLPAARGYLTAQGVAERCEFVAGDFFTSVPEGGDVYVLANVTHNWDDENALRILRTVRAAMREPCRLLLADVIVPDDDTPHPGKDLDIRILCLFAGRERTESEYFALLREAGLSVGRVTGLPLGLSMVEASPA